MWEVVTITIDGTYSGTYYCSADAVPYISSDFVNTGGSTIYLYKSLSDHSEYIRLSSLAPAEYHRSNYNTVTFNYTPNIQYNLAGQFYRFKPMTDILLLFVISVFCILRLFIHD